MSESEGPQGLGQEAMEQAAVRWPEGWGSPDECKRALIELNGFSEEDANATIEGLWDMLEGKGRVLVDMGRVITDEINKDPNEVTRLRRSRERAHHRYQPSSTLEGDAPDTQEE
jgi:hypothetical protein